MPSRSQRAHVNQENPQQATRHGATSSSNAFAFAKTPARQQLPPGKSVLGTGGAAFTGGKGLGLTARNANKVLGAKDRNGGVSKGAFTVSKYGHDQLVNAPCEAGPSSKPAPFKTAVTLSPPPTQSFQLPDHLRTPSPGVHKYASLSFSPEVEIEPEVESENSREELDLDQEVEQAGASARNYEEPFDPGFFVPDYKHSNLGDVVRGIQIGSVNADFEAFVQADEKERCEFKATFEVERVALESNADSASSLFPVPQQRPPLAPKGSSSQPSKTISAIGRKPAFGSGSSFASSSSPFDRRLGVSAAEGAQPQRNLPHYSMPANRRVLSVSSARSSPISSPASGSTSSTFTDRARSSQPFPNRLKMGSSSTPNISRNLSQSLVRAVAAGPSVVREPSSTVGTKEAELELDAFGIVDTDLSAFSDEGILTLDDMSFKFDLE